MGGAVAGCVGRPAGMLIEANAGVPGDAWIHAISADRVRIQLFGGIRYPQTATMEVSVSADSYTIEVSAD